MKDEVLELNFKLRSEVPHEEVPEYRVWKRWTGEHILLFLICPVFQAEWMLAKYSLLNKVGKLKRTLGWGKRQL